MHYKTFDTHKYIKSLQETGFNEQQAEMLVKSLLESRDFDLSILATREQVSDVKKEIAQLDTKLSKEISTAKYDILKWIVPMFIALLIAIFFKR